MALAWAIYYDDGSTFTNEGGPIDLAPCDGVIVIAQADADVGRELLHLKDFYYWERSRWFGCDLYGLWDYLRRPGWKKTLAGRNTEHRNYSAIYQRALDDDGLPPKSARRMSEVPRRA